MFPLSLGNVPKEFVNKDLGNDSHGVQEEFFLPYTLGNNPTTCENAIVIEPLEYPELTIWTLITWFLAISRHPWNPTTSAAVTFTSISLAAVIPIPVFTFDLKENRKINTIEIIFGTSICVQSVSMAIICKPNQAIILHNEELITKHKITTSEWLVNCITDQQPTFFDVTATD